LARVVRGGGWDFDASIWAVAYRGLDSPGDRYDNRGFRVVCGLVE
jgi:formylglycine-generating enzyme required for sulfatase activity